MPEISTKPTAIAHFNFAAEQYEKFTGGCTRELARFLLDLPQLQSLYDASSVVIDNACGTGVVTEEIITRCRQRKSKLPHIHGVDPASNMVKIATEMAERLGALEYFSGRIMPGEVLDFPDATFSHNITNLGILFYTDPSSGAREIHRTLKPGGVAVVTTWSTLGYLDLVIRPAQLSTRPNEQPYQLPIDPAWLLPEHLEKTMKENGGFDQVEILNTTVHYGAASLDELGELLLGSFRVIWKDWPESDQLTFKSKVASLVQKAAVVYTMVDGCTGYGIPMEAIVAVCNSC
ncbi:Methyltransferase domain 25 [Fusarium oxysporum f. sp. vasinfectum]|nr:Methyltransferase domain 25 [Fusarium oxysporum f. sp. vasinfectum]KAK2926502.1 Methyltransferase domain 25 [Fusarium oxysporum f. sp. vasinfectum]